MKSIDAPPAYDRHYDSGSTLCGELALALRAELRQLAPGRVLRVTARDQAAPQDIPAWCELVGHSLLHARHPDYWIQRRTDR